MKKTFKVHRKIWPIMLAFVSFAALAAVIVINTNNAPYRNLSNVPGTNIYSTGDIRMAAGFQIAGAYRLANGVFKLQSNSEFKVQWQDGSSEKFKVLSVGSTVGTVPVPNTQQSAPVAGGGGGPGGIPDFGGGGGGLGDGCRIGSEPRKACTSVGGGQQHCETVFVDTIIC